MKTRQYEREQGKWVWVHQNLFESLELQVEMGTRRRFEENAIHSFDHESLCFLRKKMKTWRQVRKKMRKKMTKMIWSFFWTIWEVWFWAQG